MNTATAVLRLVGLCFKNTNVGARHLHHSATHGKFYTNRFYVKKCSRCHSLNSLTLVSCFNCSNALSDADIRFRSLDHICKVSNARKSMRGPTNLNAITSGTSANAFTVATVSRSIVTGGNTATGSYRVAHIGASDGNTATVSHSVASGGNTASVSHIAGSGGNTASGGVHENALITSVLYRCFDFTIMLNRNPSAFIHLSAFPNGTFYDIKNFRKSHVELLNRISDRCLLVLSDIVIGKVCVPSIDGVILGKLRTIASEGASDKGKSLKEVLKSVVWGFNYPNTHCHADMHALLPPISTFSQFKAPFFYPLEKVLGDLKNFGRVRHYSPAQIRQMNEFDEVMEAVKASDMKMREYLLKS